MDRSVFMKKEMKEKMMILSPIMAIAFSWCMNRFLLAVISLITVFLCISVCSVCRKHESLWLFVLSGIATIPANIQLSLIATEYFSYLWGDAVVFKLVYFPLAYSILLSVEEILLGIVGRVLWKRQEPVWRVENEG